LQCQNEFETYILGNTQHTLFYFEGRTSSPDKHNQTHPKEYYSRDAYRGRRRGGRAEEDLRRVMNTGTQLQFVITFNPLPSI